MNKVTIIFDYSVEGHHLEYLNHLYNHCINKKEEHYVFLLPQSFEAVSNKLIWPKSVNVVFYFIEAEILLQFNNSGIKRSFFLCTYINSQIKVFGATNVFLISLMEFMPFLPFIVHRKCKISGIIYLIYLYRWKKSGILTKFNDSVKYILLSRCTNIFNVYLLNDVIAPVYLNKKFSTAKFKYLPDPFIPVSQDSLVDVRSQLDINKDKIICLHFGSLAERKGTIDILQSFLDSNLEQANKFCFIFAGKVSDEIKKSFYLLTDKISEKTQVIIFDEYVDYSFIGSLCLASDYILIPYKNTEQSSGVISYAAQFKTPVVAPKVGLLGKIVKRNKLGILIEDSTAESMKVFFENADNYNFQVQNYYLKNNAIFQFVKIIFEE
jgi:glycosyltransferase involved in cell wall biosynthesis